MLFVRVEVGVDGDILFVRKNINWGRSSEISLEFGLWTLDFGTRGTFRGSRNADEISPSFLDL